MNRRAGALVLVTRKGPIVVPGRGTLLARCISAGIPLASACSGRGACGRCIVRVVEGAAALSPVTRHEAEVLERNRAAGDERLSCQCRVVDAGATVKVSTGYW